MTIALVGDIHLGHNRKSYTTTEGRERFKQAIFDNAFGVIEGLVSQAGDHNIFQVGDLFDKGTNDDKTLHQALMLVNKYVETILAGNHDLRNDSTVTTTLDRVRDLSDADIIHPSYLGVPCHHMSIRQGTTISLVPYCYTQNQFEASLELAIKEAGEFDSKQKILCLHTNYDLQFEMTETTNNLTPETADRLLGVFDYVFSGHEHNRSVHKERLIFTGSLMPLSLSEATSDKGYYLLHDDGGVEFVPVWKTVNHYRKFDLDQIPDELPDRVQFVEVTGTGTSQQVIQAMKTVSKWWKTSKDLLVCKPMLTSEEQFTDSNEQNHSTEPADMVNSLRGMITDKRMLEKFDELVEEVGKCQA